MIRFFKDKEAEKIFKREMPSKLPEMLQRVALRKLRVLNRGANLNDLRVPPANRLEKFKEDRSEQHRHHRWL
jgi:proteic killer suppression protein